MGLAVTAGSFLLLTSVLSTGCKDDPQPADAGPSADQAQKDAGMVDVKQHREGLPVPDNLLE